MGKKEKIVLYAPGDRVRGKGTMSGEFGTVMDVQLFIDDSCLRPIQVKWDFKCYGSSFVDAKEIEFISKGGKP